MKTLKFLFRAVIFIGIATFVGCSGNSGNKAKDTTQANNSSIIEDSIFKPANIQEKLAYSRAVQAVIWGIPTVNYDMMYRAMVRDLKGNFNQLAYWSRPMNWKNQTLTPNADALYIMPFINTNDVGPMVLEIPPADNGRIVGTIMDTWQMALEDVGPAGVDKGKGGKYLILPPGYKEKAPAGYIVLSCPTYEGYALLRSIPKTGSEADITAAVTYLKRIKFYPLSQADKSPQTTFVDAYDILFDATIPYNMRFFESLNRMVQTQPWLDHDKAMIDILKSIGIEKGKPFSPDAKTKTMMISALTEGHEWMTDYYETKFEPFFKASRWFLPANAELIKDVTDGFTNPDSYPVDPRGSLYSFVFTTVKHLGAGQFYLFVTRDNKGQPLDGSKNYQLYVPAKVPVHQYWSLTLYDFATHALIRDVSYASRSSLTPELKANADSSTDIYLGPKAPEGKEGNWIPTKAGGRFECIFRLYGPDKSFFEKKAWILPDIEEVK